MTVCKKILQRLRLTARTTSPKAYRPRLRTSAYGTETNARLSSALSFRQIPNSLTGKLFSGTLAQGSIKSLSQFRQNRIAEIPRSFIGPWLSHIVAGHFL